ncbi:EamA family transporter RarD [Effusibacillus dendaii]|uniref:EamA family transporter n=1 Tax=Effusibacillus dendaii TaxID=2743772 RepID=A0A7I8DH86_9BACL|nr:EamA family transporter RarD [Effusibacillus dendaii]BCJ87970.1 EamA family transporter [Effusibacillus dendaii]
MNAGYIYAILTYAIWGVLPMYWKLFSEVSAWEILSHRIIWSVVFVLLLAAVLNKRNAIKAAIPDWKSKGLVMISSILISANWVTYIWAVNNGHMVEASLGYYMNPLVSVLLGVFFLRERLRKLQWGAIGLATMGVLILTFSYGHFPWIALSLAFSFGFYGLAKKKVRADTIAGLTLETIVVFPLALIYLIGFEHGGTGWHVLSGWQMIVLLLSGVATALPLLWFAEATKRLPLSVLGFIQYLSPTITLLLGLFVYHEDFTKTDILSFGLIWIALVVYMFQMTRKQATHRIEATGV